MPSTIPTVSAEAPSPVTMNTGSRLWIISEETSMSRLTNPSTHAPRGIAAVERAVACAALVRLTSRDHGDLRALAAALSGVIDPLEHELSAGLGPHVELQIG